MPKLLYIALFVISALHLTGCSGSDPTTPPQSPLAEISGKVVLNGTGFDGVNMILSGATTTITQNGGEYIFENLQPGSYTITAKSTGYNFLPDSKAVSLARGDKIVVDVEAGKVGIHVPADAVTIQLAINMALAGETIYVDDGMYKGNGNVAITFGGKQLTVTSKKGPDNCIIDCEGLNQGFIFNNNENLSSVLAGFTIRNCRGNWGAAIELSGANPSIIGNIFDNNIQGSGGFGAAIGGNNASPLIDKNTFTSNSCDGQWLSGVISFVNSSSPIVTNNILSGNTCRAINMTLPEGNSPKVINNTIINNATGIYVDRRVNTYAQIYRNNIIVGNSKGLEVVFGTDALDPVLQNNLIFKGLPGLVWVLFSTWEEGCQHFESQILPVLNAVGPTLNHPDLVV